MVKHLLAYGASVHIRDRHDRTALMEAITVDNHEIIKILIKCGAHMTGSARALGENLCAAAARGKDGNMISVHLFIYRINWSALCLFLFIFIKGLIKRLQSYRLAGANLSQGDFSGRTALHMACLHNQKDVFEYLLKHSVETASIDLLKMTPYEYAVRGGHKEIITLLHANGIKGTDCTDVQLSPNNGHAKDIE